MNKIVALLALLVATNTVAAPKVAKVYNIRTGVKVALAETPCMLPYMKKAKTSKAAVVQNEGGMFIKGCWYEVEYNGKKLYHIDWANPKAEGDFAELEPTLFAEEEVQ